MTSPGLDLDALLATARGAAEVGSAIVKARFGAAATGVREKRPGDWVSAADIDSEQAIRAVLARDAPGLDFFGEEGGGVRGEVGWLVDPLDGTVNFLHGLPMVGVSVALVVAGEPV